MKRIIEGLMFVALGLIVVPAHADQVILDDIRHDDTTRWPDGFSPPSSGGLDDHD